MADDGVNNVEGGFCRLVGINTPWHEFKLESIVVYIWCGQWDVIFLLFK